MEKRYYIAYGSNLHLSQMWKRCPTARIIGTSKLEGWELLFKGSKTGSYLTIVQNPNCCVPVAVWDVTEKDERSLDIYEGFPRFYYKMEMKLPIKGIKSGITRNRNVFVYIMHEERQLGIPSSRYMRTCLEGYDAFGFDEQILYEALRKSMEESECQR